MSTEQDARSQRYQQIDQWRAAGINPYPNDFEPTEILSNFIAKYAGYEKSQLAELQVEHVAMAGRVMAYRSNFCTFQDRSGSLQVYAHKKALSEEHLQTYKNLNVGDIAGFTGIPFKTHTGELTLKVTGVRLLNRAIRQLPEKYHGMQDKELRYRMRYVDLIVNESARHTFKIRNKIMRTLRQFFDSRDFSEVETPMMHPLVGGAAARPFVTHHNQLNMELYMRIAPELYLKRLIVGGMERVYEINRNFRNEGLDHHHNPEFTTLEFYQAYATYEHLMNLTEDMMIAVARCVTGNESTLISYGDHPIDYGKTPLHPPALVDLAGRIG